MLTYKTFLYISSSIKTHKILDYSHFLNRNSYQTEQQHTVKIQVSLFIILFVFVFQLLVGLACIQTNHDKTRSTRSLLGAVCSESTSFAAESLAIFLVIFVCTCCCKQIKLSILGVTKKAQPTKENNHQLSST